MLRASVLAMALLVNFPVLWAALFDQTTPVDAALVRLLITVPIVAVLLAFLRAATSTPAKPTQRRARSDGDR